MENNGKLNYKCFDFNVKQCFLNRFDFKVMHCLFSSVTLVFVSCDVCVSSGGKVRLNRVAGILYTLYVNQWIVKLAS